MLRYRPCLISVLQVMRVCGGILIIWAWGSTAWSVEQALQAQPSIDTLSEQINGIGDRITRNESVLYPTATAVAQINARLSAIEVSISAGKYLASAMTSGIAGLFFLTWFRDTPGSRRRLRQQDKADDDDSGPVHVPRHVRRWDQESDQ